MLVVHALDINFGWRFGILRAAHYKRADGQRTMTETVPQLRAESNVNISKDERKTIKNTSIGNQRAHVRGRKICKTSEKEDINEGP